MQVDNTSGEVGSRLLPPL